jgi:hypothetical protein
MNKRILSVLAIFLVLASGCTTTGSSLGDPDFGYAETSSAEAPEEQAERSWHSPSLRTETAIGPNGAVTTHTAPIALR